MKKLFLITKSIFKSSPLSAIVTLLCFLYNSLLPAATAIISIRLFDSAEKIILHTGNQDELLYYAFILFALLFVGNILGTLGGVAKNAGVFEKGNAAFRISLCQKAACLPLIAYENEEILNMKERAEKAVEDNVLPRTFFHTLTIVKACLASAGIAAVLAKYYIWLLPLSFLTVLPFLIARIIRGKEFYKLKKIQAQSSRKLKYIWELFSSPSSVKEMRVMGFDSYLGQKWQETRDSVNEETWKLEKRDAVSLLLCDALRITGYFSSIIIILILALRDIVPLGVFGASIAAFLSLQNNMKELLIGLGNFPKYLAYAGDYYSFFDLPEADPGSLEFQGLSSAINLVGVSFQYPNTYKKALCNVSLTIKKGETTVIVGENGSGKTTLAKLILGLFEPSAGTVLYDGVALNLYSKESLHKKISIVQQDYQKYELSLRENITLSDTERISDDDTISKSFRESGINRDIKLDELLGRTFGGTDLSGGEWQKLAITRGLFKNSELIVLDEPTASLDPLIENEVLSKFIESAREKTAIIISHRIGICTKADNIVVLKNGEVSETGKHSDLLRANGDYAKLFTEQAKWYKEDSSSNSS